MFHFTICGVQKYGNVSKKRRKVNLKRKKNILMAEQIFLYHFEVIPLYNHYSIIIHRWKNVLNHKLIRIDRNLAKFSKIWDESPKYHREIYKAKKANLLL